MRRFLLAPLLLAGCFSPDYGNPAFSCGPEGECPAGYECRVDGLCHRVGSSVDPPDAARPSDGGADGPGAIDGTPLANDDCPAPGGSLLVEGVAAAGTLSGASAQLTPSCQAGGADVFYRLELGEDRQVTIDLSSIAAMGVSLRSADCATELACAADGAAGEELVIDALPAGTYQVAVQAEGGAVGDFAISYVTGEPVIRPPNDACSGAAVLLPGATVAGGTSNARDDSVASCGNGIDVVYAFTVPGTDPARAVLTLSNAAFDAALHVEAACGATSLGCAQTGSGPGETLDLFSLAPGTYHVWVEVVSGPAGSFDLQLELLPAIPPPPNDTCDDAEPLADGEAAAGTTLGAADDYDLACVSDGPDTVHELSLSADAAALVTITPTTSWPLAADLRAGATCADTPASGCLAGGFGDLPRYLNRPQLAAGDWDVVVDGVGGAAGDYTIRLDTRAPDATFGYWIVPSTRPFVSIAGAPGAVQLPVATRDATTTYLDAPDEGEYEVPLPFAFPFFGATTTRVWADVNRFLSLDSPAEAGQPSYLNDCPLDGGDPFGILAVLWDDGWAVSGAEIWYLVEGSAPNRRVVIEWKGFDFLNCPPCTLVGARTSEQAVLHENGDVSFHYGPRSAPATQSGCDTHQLGCDASIGIRAPGVAAPVDSDAFSCNANAVSENFLLTFVHPH